MSWQILQGDARQMPLADESVDCCITSPPYFGLRDYGITGQIGLEPSPEEYGAQLVMVFREVRRVLKPWGTCWIVIGDSYATQSTPGLTSKNLMGIPWRVAFALQNDGWYLRQEIVWAKSAPMPESVTDRFTSATEKIFLFAKSERYYFDNEAVKERSVDPESYRGRSDRNPQRTVTLDGGYNGTRAGFHKLKGKTYPTRNRRNFWLLGPENFPDAHLAVFPTEIPRLCILAGTSEAGVCSNSNCGKPWVRMVECGPSTWEERKNNGAPMRYGMTPARSPVGRASTNTLGWKPSCDCNAPARPAVVLDPFSGSGTTVLVADRLGRHGISLDLSPEYCRMARDRVGNEAPLFESLTQTITQSEEPQQGGLFA